MGARERASVVADIEGSLTGSAERLVAEVVGGLPAYAALARSQRTEVAAITAWACRLVLRLWVNENRLSADDLRRFRSVGMARALDGRPLDAVLRAYRLVGAEFVDLVLMTDGGRLDPSDVRALFRCVLVAMDDAAEAITEGHASAGRTLAGDRARAYAHLLTDLVTGHATTVSALADRCGELGIHLPDHPRVLVVGGPVTPAGEGDTEGRPARRTDPRLDQRAMDDLVRAILGDRPAGVDPTDDTALADAGATVLRGVVDGLGVALLPRSAVGAGPVAALGRRACAIDGRPVVEARAAFRLAEAAVSGAPPWAFVQRPVLDEGDAQALVLLRAPDRADPDRLVETVLAGAAGEAALMATLDALMATGRATDAARRLGVHPQTVRYRRRRLRALTGRDVARPWDRFVLEIARVCATGRA